MNKTVFCTTCGNKISTGASFCTRCGKQIPQHGGQQLKPKAQIQSNTPKLLVKGGGNKWDYDLPNTAIVIGREQADLVIVGIPGISRKHAQIVPAGAGHTLVDLQSMNGTYLRGKKIPSGQPMQLHDGDIIRIGDQYGNSAALTYVNPQVVPIAQATCHLSPSQLSSLSVITIGRDPASTLPLNTPLVSWHHAEIRRRADGSHMLVDLKSTNGTYVNQRRISQALLKKGDIIDIGTNRLDYKTSTLVGSPDDIRVDALNVFKDVRAKGGKNERVKNGKLVLLNNISLTILPREFVALVGGSGAGKSTLMDALNGLRRAPRGQVLYNGENLYTNFDMFRTNIGYVPQADILHTGLTVKNALWYTAMLRLPPDTRQAEIKIRIEDVLQTVDMTDKNDDMIGILSGGQKKRVSIASELLSDPKLIFLDEPTSGLDPGLDKKMMRTLKDLADNGRTILLTTHATNNILDTCDQVVFLSESNLVFYGPPQKALNYFQTTDFATIYSKVGSVADAQVAATKYQNSQEFQQFVVNRQKNVPPKNPISASRNSKRFNIAEMIRQFIIFSRRYLDLIRHDIFSLVVLLAIMPIIGSLLLIIGSEHTLVGDSAYEIEQALNDNGIYMIAADAQKVLLMMSLSAILLGVFAASYEIIKERAVYQRERMSNLKIIPYLASKVTVLMSFGFIQCVALLMVVSLKIKLPDDGVLLPAVLEFLITLWVSLLVGISMGLVISALVRNSASVIYLVMVVLFMQIIFSGALFKLPEGAEIISYLTPTRWTLEGMGISADVDSLNNMGQMLVSGTNMVVENQLKFNVDYERTVEHLLSIWVFQFFYAAACLVLTAVILKRQDGH